MSPLSRLAALALLTATLAAQEEVLAIAGFESGSDGFDGALVQETGDAKVGAGAGVLRNADPSGWVESGKDLPGLVNDFTEVRFWAKSATAKSIAVRLTDATGQAFQHRLAIEGSGWRQLKLTTFAPAAQSWGGADDKRWHPPATRVQFILEGGANDIRLDAIEAVLAAKSVPALAARAAALAKAKPVIIGDFEDGADGFGDALTVEQSGGKVGRGCAKLVNADAWVATGKALSLGGKDILELSLWVKSLQAANLAVRLTDATGQAFQHRPHFDANGEWQQIRLTEFAPAMESWGGANDKQWHGPAKAIAFILEARNATVRIDGVRVLVAP